MIEDKQRRKQDEDKMEMDSDLERTPAREEIEAAERELALMKAEKGTKRKRQWNIKDTNNENIDPDQR